MKLRTLMARRLREYRHKRGLTQHQLAERAGLSRGYLARLEIAMQDPTLSTLEKLAAALRVKVAKLIE